MPKPLSTLTDWSKQHIGAVFELGNESDALMAIEETFSPDVKVMLNGAPMNREGVKQVVLAFRRAAPNGLKVEWMSVVDVPNDASNRNGSFGGVYIIRGLKHEVPGKGLLDFERHKSVNVVIQSQYDDPEKDSRRIVNLVFVAANVPVKAKL
ncbi:hypothetical protein OE88DRAFT_1661992 [Heliocybe sulcata]|uniref:Uncharacterized protein n=1 Tax=Heliocybe sulcata TaxID=5364 RepID=A0A5C3MZ95_9AGAM|nr:hypothetical protein OE88DRAFT_1661992 [Heliocybe sulcata]